ncbi:uncharacterized protein V1513DRAFT_447530 [Lipomyces chichibuensis]|uniref:uncharacterized protein n=1 Tax=Lipomyces chichibuensis TaxID=1546026 RepID=UPI0033435708
MLPSTTRDVRNQTYSSVPQSSSASRQPSARYTDNPSYVPSPRQQSRTNQSASYGTYESGNPFADPPSRPDRYYSHGSAPLQPYNAPQSGRGIDPEKYSPGSRIFGLQRRNFLILLCVAAAVAIAIVVAATVKNVSHFMSNSTSSTSALGEVAAKGSTSSSATSETTSAAATMFIGWHNATNSTYIYPNSTVSASPTASPSSNITGHYYF